MFDILQYTRELEASGWSEAQANALIKVVSSLMDKDFSTKSDFEKHKIWCKAEFEKIALEFKQVYKEFDRIDERFRKVDERFDKIDERFEKVDERFDKVDERFNKVDQEFLNIRTEIKAMLVEYATKEDLKALGDKITIRLGGMMVVMATLIVSLIKL